MHAVACALASVDSIFATLNTFELSVRVNSLIAAVEVAVTVHENKRGETNGTRKRKDFTGKFMWSRMIC